MRGGEFCLHSGLTSTRAVGALGTGAGAETAGGAEVEGGAGAGVVEGGAAAGATLGAGEV